MNLIYKKVKEYVLVFLIIVIVILVAKKWESACTSQVQKENSNNTASLYDEINRINKEHSNPYAASSPLPPERIGTLPAQTYKGSTERHIMNDPIFVGNDPRLQGYGESRYDRNMSYDGLDWRSVEDVRAEKRKAEIQSITINIGIALVIIALIFGLIKAATSKKTTINETDK